MTISSSFYWKPPAATQSSCNQTLSSGDKQRGKTGKEHGEISDPAQSENVDDWKLLILRTSHRLSFRLYSTAFSWAKDQESAIVLPEPPKSSVYSLLHIVHLFKWYTLSLHKHEVEIMRCFLKFGETTKYNFPSLDVNLIWTLFVCTLYTCTLTPSYNFLTGSSANKAIKASFVWRSKTRSVFCTITIKLFAIW